MSAQLGLSLPIGTKVRMVKEHPMGRLRVLRIGDIVTRIDSETDDYIKVRFDHDEQQGYCLSDDEWELIEEKQEPKQGDELLVQDIGWEDGWNRVEFVCFYKGKVLVTGNCRFVQYDIWRFPPKKIDITLQEIADWKGVEKELINIINE